MSAGHEIEILRRSDGNLIVRVDFQPLYLSPEEVEVVLPSDTTVLKSVEHSGATAFGGVELVIRLRARSFSFVNCQGKDE